MLDMNTLLAEHFCVAVDSQMGTGKTTALLDYMRNENQHRFIFVTPLRSEIARVIKETDGKFEQPRNPFGTKIDSLHGLLRKKVNIAMSHALFALASQETIDLISAGEYVLVIDEAMSLTVPYNVMAATSHLPPVKPGDIEKIFERERLVYIHSEHGAKYGQIDWLAEEVEDTYLEGIARLINTGALYCAGADGSSCGQIEGQSKTAQKTPTKAFIWEFPPNIFKAAKNVIALSYLCKGSIFDCYLRYHDMTPYYISSRMVGEKKSEFVVYGNSPMPKWDLIEKIDVITGPLNDIGKGRTALSMNWYKNATDDQLKTINNNMRNVIEGGKFDTSDVFWTAPKEATRWNPIRLEQYNKAKKNKTAPTVKRPIECIRHNYIEHASVYQKLIADSDREYNELYPKWRQMESMNVEDPLTGELAEQLEYLRQVCEDGPLVEEDFSTFVACSIKATNKYSNRHLCLYCINRFLQPQIADFYEKRGFSIDEDVYALSEMIQWIWRSAIRKGESITVYIPSERMRKLFLDWLGVDEDYYIQKHKEQC